MTKPKDFEEVRTHIGNVPFSRPQCSTSRNSPTFYDGIMLEGNSLFEYMTKEEKERYESLSAPMDEKATFVMNQEDKLINSGRGAMDTFGELNTLENQLQGIWSNQTQLVIDIIRGAI